MLRKAEGKINVSQHKEKIIIADKILFYTVLMLIIAGIFMLYSASSYGAERDSGDSFFYVKKQAISFVLGLFLMLAVAHIGLERLQKGRWWVLGFSILLLALVFIPGLGVENYGARRWLNLGFTTIQPSEFAKFGLVIFCASSLSKKGSNTIKGIMPVVGALLVMCVLIMLQPNMSITLCIGIVTLIMLFLGGMKFKHFAVIATPVLIALPLMIILEPYRMKRLIAFIDPWANPLSEGYQLIQSYYALGSGGLFGLGYGNSRQKFLFLPFAESDFIFSVIGEELGLLGCIFFLALYVIIVWRGIVIAMRATQRFDCYLAAGITAVIGVQTALNIAVVSGSIPPTGLPLPFVSAGGSSLLVFMIAIGLLQNIAARTRYSQKKQPCHSM